MTLRLSIVASALAVAVAAAGCAHSDKADLKGTSGSQITTLPGDLVPSQVLGMNVTDENVLKTLANTQKSYVNAVSLYGFRKDQLLQATLQISRFNANARYQTDKFRQQILLGVGTAQGETVQVSGVLVYLTLGERQRVFSWFKGPYWFVMSVRDDFTQPRSLLRQLLQINP
jgi:hypothetical protein